MNDGWNQCSTPSQGWCGAKNAERFASRLRDSLIATRDLACLLALSSSPIDRLNREEKDACSNHQKIPLVEVDIPTYGPIPNLHLIHHQHLNASTALVALRERPDSLITTYSRRIALVRVKAHIFAT